MNATKCSFSLWLSKHYHTTQKTSSGHSYVLKRKIEEEYIYEIRLFCDFLELGVVVFVIYCKFELNDNSE